MVVTIGVILVYSAALNPLSNSVNGLNYFIKNILELC